MPKSYSSPNIVPINSRKKVEQQIFDAFEMIGGISRLAAWANQDENYGEFLKIWSKLVPKPSEDKQEVDGHLIEYRSMVPQSPLNRVEPVQIEQKPDEQ